MLKRKISWSFIHCAIFGSSKRCCKTVKGICKTFDKLEVKALSVGGKAYDANQLDAIASLPTRDEAIAKLMYVMKAPIEKFVRTFAEPHAKLVRTLAAVKDQKAS